MKHRIEISSVAEAEADSVFLRLSQVTSPVKVSQQFAYSTFAKHHSKRLVKTRKNPTQPNNPVEADCLEILLVSQRSLAVAQPER